MCRNHYQEWRVQKSVAASVCAWPIAARIGWSTGPREVNGCRLWTGADVDRDGYPRVKIDGKRYRVSRLLLGLNTGDPRVAMHSCDTPICVEPAHLSAATRAKNDADRAQKGRAYRGCGEDHPAAKLTNPEVFEIRRARAAGMRVVHLAARFGVSRGIIDRILSGARWASITEATHG